MKTVGVSGHFGTGLNMLNGQTIKTKITADELIRRYGKNNVILVDSHGGIKAIPGILLDSFRMFRECKNIVMLPADKGVFFFTPVFYFYNHIFHRTLHYDVIGGWLAPTVKKHPWLKWMLKSFDGIYVETITMKRELDKMGFNNVEIMANFKNLRIVSLDECQITKRPPLKVCTFSRVLKEKGIEDAIKAVHNVNKKSGKTVYELDIYGEIDPAYADRFEKIMKKAPGYIRYKGKVPYDQSVFVLKDYFALLFPTYFYGEGFAGTLLDAMAAGLPTVATDWIHNKDVIRNGINGILLPPNDVNALSSQLEKMALNPEKWNALRISTLKEAEKYTPETVISIMTKNFL